MLHLSRSDAGSGAELSWKAPIDTPRLAEVPVVLSVVRIALCTRGWYEQACIV
jgi:hypothetical protein